MSLSDNESQISIFNTESDLHQRRSVKASGLALLGIVVAIGIVAEHCEGLTIPTVDHPSPHKRRLTGQSGVRGRCLRTAFLRCRTAP